MVEEIPHIVWMTTPDGAMEYVNRQGRVYAGPRSESRRVDWMSLVHADDVEMVTQAREMADRTGTPYRADCRIRRFDGEYRWHDLSGIPIHDDLAAAVKWIGTADDIDDAKTWNANSGPSATEGARTLALLETLQSKAPVGFGFVDRDYRRVLVNETLAAFNGSTVADRSAGWCPTWCR